MNSAVQTKWNACRLLRTNIPGWALAHPYFRVDTAQQAKLKYFATELLLYINLVHVAKQRIEATQQILEMRSA